MFKTTSQTLKLQDGIMFRLVHMVILRKLQVELRNTHVSNIIVWFKFLVILKKLITVKKPIVLLKSQCNQFL
jgi:hypothetical protein